MAQHLGLDEALVSVQRAANVSGPLDVFYQLDECFGCQMSKYKTLLDANDSFTIGTKFNLQLELRKSNLGAAEASSGCKFDDLQLNSHGHYKINVAQSNGGNLNCSLQTLADGDCMVCPFAILVCVLFILTVGEKVLVRLHSKRKRGQFDGKRHSGDTLETASQEPGDQQAVGTTGDADLSANDAGPPRAPLEQEIFEPTRARRRIEALDAFRGLTIAGMIFVNYGGAGYAILEHKPWDGITLADFVFPFFIFAMGASIAISTKSMVKRKTFQATAWSILRRSFNLVALGLFLNSKWLDYDRDNLNSLRLTGVLQRFGVSYLIVALMFATELTVSKWIKAQSLSNVPLISQSVNVIFELLTAVQYLAIYVFVTFYFEYDSNCPIGYVGPGGQTEGGRYANCTGGAAAWLDRLVLGENHLYHDHEVKEIYKTQVTHDPEGLLGYTTSVLLTLIGLQCGKILLEQGRRERASHKLCLMALSQWILILTLGCALILIIPINKRLWSLTFVVTTGLGAFVVLTLFYMLLDVYQCKQTLILRLLQSAGKNSIFLYVGHSLLSGMLPWWFPVDQASHLQLLVRLSWSTFVWLLVANYMERKRIFVKV